MTAHGKTVAESALALSADERAELAERLLLSLDEKYQAEVELAWNAIIERRMSDIDAGRVTPIPGDEALRHDPRTKSVVKRHVILSTSRHTLPS